MVQHSAKTELTGNDRREMLEMLRGGANTGGLQELLMKGGPINQMDMTALIAKLRELETSTGKKLSPELSDKLDKADKNVQAKPNASADNFSTNYPLVLALNGSSGATADMMRNFAGAESKIGPIEVGGMATQSPGPLPQGLEFPGQTLQFGGPPGAKV